LFHSEGFCSSPFGLSTEQVDVCSKWVFERFDEIMFTLRMKGMESVLKEVGFTEFKMRGYNRYDILLSDAQGKSHISFLEDDVPWLSLVKKILGDDCVLRHAGCMLSYPGSENQHWHSDGPHIDQTQFVTAHCLNVFVPLVELKKNNGPTQFIPTSHRNWDTTEKSMIAVCDAGQFIVMDYRIKHRGLRNRSTTPRPLLYFTYAIPSFKDKHNFSKKRYEALPPLIKFNTRQETIHKRRNMRGEYEY